MDTNEQLSKDLTAYEQRKAARAMLAALKDVAALIRKHGIGDSDAESEPVVAGLYAAIAAASAAGIKAEAPAAVIPATSDLAKGDAP